MFIVLQAIYFFLPAYVANMIPVICGTASVSGKLSQPIDGYRSIHGVRIFGDSKTWGGLIGGTFVGMIVFIIQQELYRFSFFQSISLIYYPSLSLLFGLLMALGALCGDLTKSFVKRRIGLTSGASWFPFDQIDYVLGAFVFIIPFYVPSTLVFIVLLLVAPVFHYATNYLAFVLGLKKVWW